MRHPSLPIGSQGARFAVNTIYCVGQNYRRHARELGFAESAPPVFFMKDVHGLVTDGASIAYPPSTARLHYEVEWVVALGAGGMHMSVQQAASCIAGFAVGIDLTRRDLQDEARKKGMPWDMAKNFAGCCPCSALIDKEALRGSENEQDIALTVDGQLRQRASVGQRVWDSCQIISALSALVPLQAGTLIYTGTPEGVGAVEVGSTLRAFCPSHESADKALDVTVRVVAP
ncbi:MAG: fumarylacetoacetate hydrolase family protein [Alphaproteobacteria bacterium GM202ARS2]|nr:fumarylacetoacetate hydrolase family protein [Alphaproteobacteria bacterium GM202ARS2]